jgi:LuxR family maltose regulon positive regulatory protein
LRQRPSQLAKLTRPRLQGAFARERLLRRLDEAHASRSVIWVVGPPGAGKTTLIASWLDARRLPSIWYQVDSDDADPATFFYYLGRAAQPLARPGQRPLPLLTPEYLSELASFSRRFFRNLFERLGAPGIIVLDNYQELPCTSEFQQRIADAAAEAPSGMGIVVASRERPPACFARQIANENLALFDWEALKLSLEEARAIAVARGQPDGEAIARLHKLVDGWAAGFTLMLEQAHEPTFALRRSSSHQTLFDYFAAQILNRVSEDVRAFLLATACLPSVTHVLAEALTGDRKAESILEDLHRRHFFVHKRTGDEPTYLYHALFRSFLRTQAQRTLEPGALHDVYRRAARLLEQGHDLEACFDLYCEAQDWVSAGRVIVDHAPELLAKGRFNTVLERIARMPDEQRAEAPWLGYWQARAMQATSPAAARARFVEASGQFTARSDTVGELLCVAGILECHWLQWATIEEQDEWIDRALELLRGSPRIANPELELRLHSVLAMALHQSRPYSPVFAYTQQRIVDLLHEPMNDEARFSGGVLLFGTVLGSADVALGAWLVRLLEPLAQSFDVSALSRLLWLRRLACFRVYVGEVAEAVGALDRAEALAIEENLDLGGSLQCFWGCYISIACGDLPRAATFVRRLRKYVVRDKPVERPIFHHVHCLLAHAKGETDEAVRHGRQALALAKAGGPAWMRWGFGLPAIYALIEAGDLGEAQTEIESLGRFIQGSPFELFQAECKLAEACIAAKREPRDAFRASLTEALRCSRDLDYLFYFRSLFRSHRLLLCEALREDIEADYVREVIQRFRISPEPPVPPGWPWPVRIFALGRFQVERNGAKLHFRHKTPRRLIELLKTLIALGSHDVPESRLVDLLWAAEDGDSAAHALGTAVHRLRKLLGYSRAVDVCDGAVSLDRSLVWIDAVQLEEELQVAGRSGLQTQRTAETIAELYRGAFLPADENAAWAIPIRERLRCGFVRFAERHGEQLESERRWPEATDWYLRVLDVEVTSENLYQGLMRCYLHTDRRAEGVSAFRRLQRMLSVTLGIQPSAASVALCDALQARRVVTRAPS